MSLIITIDLPSGSQILVNIDETRFYPIRKFLKGCKQEYYGGTYSTSDLTSNPLDVPRITLPSGKIYLIPLAALTKLQDKRLKGRRAGR